MAYFGSRLKSNSEKIETQKSFWYPAKFISPYFAFIFYSVIWLIHFFGVRCKKSGYFTKPMETFTIRKVNHSPHPEKWYKKVPIIASKYKKKIFATEPDLF